MAPASAMMTSTSMVATITTIASAMMTSTSMMATIATIASTMMTSMMTTIMIIIIIIASMMIFMMIKETSTMAIKESSYSLSGKLYKADHTNEAKDTTANAAE